MPSGLILVIALNNAKTCRRCLATTATAFYFASAGIYYMTLYRTRKIVQTLKMCWFRDVALVERKKPEGKSQGKSKCAGFSPRLEKQLPHVKTGLRPNQTHVLKYGLRRGRRATLGREPRPAKCAGLGRGSHESSSWTRGCRPSPCSSWSWRSSFFSQYDTQTSLRWSRAWPRPRRIEPSGYATGWRPGLKRSLSSARTCR